MNGIQRWAPGEDGGMTGAWVCGLAEGTLRLSVWLGWNWEVPDPGFRSRSLGTPGHREDVPPLQQGEEI